MPKLRLTDAAIKRLPPPAEGSLIYWDTLTTGLGLRITYGGTRTFVLQARVLKEGRWIDQKRSLGRYPGLSLADARQSAKVELEGIHEGKQLGQTRAQAVKERIEASVNTFAHVRGEFLEKYRTRANRRPAPRTLEELRRVLHHRDLAGWEERPLAEITRRDVQNIVDGFLGRGQETAANRYLTYLKMLFAWALDRDILTTDPADRVKRQGAEQSRERVLGLDEMRAIWQSTAPTQAGKGDLFAGIVKVLMLTGQRREEVAGMAWPEIDLAGALWTLPGARAKNHRDHLIPLTGPVLAILHERQREQALMGFHTDLVFTTTGTTPFSGWSRSKTRLDGRARKLAALHPWTLHDLRRTLVTRMGEDLHIPPHIVEAVVNHASGAKAGVAGTYNRAVYLDERAKALEAWAGYVLQSVGERGGQEVGNW
jgi:integrase